MKITTELIMSWNPCAKYPEERIRELIGDGKTPIEVAGSDIPVEDKVWFLLHIPILTEDQLYQLAREWGGKDPPARDIWDAWDAWDETRARDAAWEAARKAWDVAWESQLKRIREML